MFFSWILCFKRQSKQKLSKYFSVLLLKKSYKLNHCATFNKKNWIKEIQIENYERPGLFGSQENTKNKNLLSIA